MRLQEVQLHATVPTVADRVAQAAAAMALEPLVEKIFHPDSYGYRPGRAPVDGVAVCRRRCWESDWVLDLDIQSFFDSAPHALIVKAVEANTDLPWVMLYVKRWLIAPAQHRDGTLHERDRGTPQGSSVSPVLANLFLHYAFDAWMARTYPTIRFERYVDDMVVHCTSERQARALRAAIEQRMVEVGLKLHPTKTRIVYCKDSNRRGEHEHISFTFLGYTFRPRRALNKRKGVRFTSFLPAMSQEKLSEKGREVRRWRLHRRTNDTLEELAEAINPIVRGWMNYWGRFGQTQMHPLLKRINTYLVRWAQRKYKRLRAFKRLKAWWDGVTNRDPGLFAHWRWKRGFEPTGW
jgi:RNA-directed DNA polymerase